MANVPMTEVELSISCKNLRDRDAFSKSDPIVAVLMRQFAGDKFNEIGRTERIENSLDPEFSTKITLNYYFEEAQRLKFEVYDIDSDAKKLSKHDFLGATELTLGEIVGSPGSKVHRQLGGLSGAAGSILVSAEEVGANKEVAEMQFRGIGLDNKDFLGKSDPFLMIYRLNDDQSRTLVFRSEVKNNTLNPTWRPFKVPVRLMASGNDERVLQIECYDSDADGGQAHDMIGVCQSSFGRLRRGPVGGDNLYELINVKKQSKKKYKNSGQLQLMQFATRTEYSFLDYIRGGTQIHFTVAVDFTASNGNPTMPDSLHYMNPYEPNQYMAALKAVGEVCQDYDTDKMFPALGFGAKLPNGQVSHEFFLNFHPTDPHCRGVDGILQAYRQAIMSTSLYGPTNFSPVIYHVAKFAGAAARDGSHYFVLLIITDGIITDIDQTVAAIVYASSLPMSIIIVGVGNEDFEAMAVLDADKGRLSAGGRFAERDIVQFVPFRKYQKSSAGNWAAAQAHLAKEVLAEVPSQLTAWMRVRNLAPRPPPQVSVGQPTAEQPSPASHAAVPNQPSQQQAYQPPQQGYPPSQPPQQGYPPSQPPQQGYPPSQPPQQAYPPSQPPQQGYPPSQPPQQGYPPSQPPQQGYPPSQPPQQGYPPSQPPQQGYSPNQPPQQGYPPQQPFAGQQPYPAQGQAAPIGFVNPYGGQPPPSNYSAAPAHPP